MPAPEPAGTKMNKNTDMEGDYKDRDVGLLSWDPETARDPPTALAVTFRWSLGTSQS